MTKYSHSFQTQNSLSWVCPMCFQCTKMLLFHNKRHLQSKIKCKGPTLWKVTIYNQDDVCPRMSVPSPSRHVHWNEARYSALPYKSYIYWVGENCGTAIKPILFIKMVYKWKSVGNVKKGQRAKAAPAFSGWQCRVMATTCFIQGVTTLLHSQTGKE